MAPTSPILTQHESPAAPTALIVLVFLTVASPWPFGSVHPLAILVITLIALVTALSVAATGAWRGRLMLPSFPIWPLLGLVALAALQLVPLAPSLHAVLAPGSYAIWHPEESAAAALLGPVSQPISIDPQSTHRWLAFTFGLAALAVLAAPALRERRFALRATLVVAGGGLAVALYGIVARTLFGNLLYGTVAVPTVSPFGPFVSKNHFAGYVEMAALLISGLAIGLADAARRRSSPLGWVESRRAGRVVLAGGAAAAMGLAVLVSLSRGGVVALALGGVVLVALGALVRGRKRPRRSAIWGLGALLGLAVLALAVVPREGRQRIESLGGITADSSGSFRTVLWHDTVRLAAASPFLGHGLGAFADALPRFKTAAGELRVEHAENDYLEMLAEGGVLGLGLALALVALLTRHAVRGLKEQEDRLLRGLGLGAAAGFWALLVHSAFDFNLHIPSSALLFAFLAALSVGASGHATRSPSRRWPLVAASAVVFCLLLATVATPPAGSSTLDTMHRLSATGAITPLRGALAEASLVDSLRHHPADAEAWVVLGWLHSIRGARKEGAALARYGANLDPRRKSLQETAAQLAAAAGPPARD
ncbi:MAG TPA: O-antigen ligase family protein [Vicinamibacteria bacterium]|nr:O-antigen ligase family protein [Vicinamibacteria bacterium]